jgi:protein SCO1
MLAAAVMVAAIAVAAGATALWMGLALPAQIRAGATDIGGPFTLVDNTGAQVTEAALKGKPTVINFGYTFCPEVCPTTLTDLAQWMHVLGPGADILN